MKMQIEISQNKSEKVISIEGDREGFQTFIEWLKRSTRFNDSMNEVKQDGTILRVTRKD